MPRVTTVLLAGGKGSRLEPLTNNDAKPAIPFGGVYRIIDFTLSNCVNSGLRRVFVLTQFKSMSLERHINKTWRSMVNWQVGEFIEPVPAQQRLGDHWYRGNADAVYQNIYAIEKDNPDYVVVLAGDHIYKMDYGQMLEQHIANKAAVTVAGLPVPVKTAARQFGVMQINEQSQIAGFEEKPESPSPLPDDPDVCLASMGIYIFEADFLFDQLCKSALREGTRHDFGRDIIPASIETGRAFAFMFRDEKTSKPGYWRDVGTLDSYYDANMELLAIDSGLRLEDSNWPVWREATNRSPARVFGSSQVLAANPSGSMISAGCTVHGCVIQSVLGVGCVIEKDATVENCVLLDGVRVEAGAVIRNTIVASNLLISRDSRIGFDRDADLARGATVTKKGRLVLSEPIPNNSQKSDRLFSRV